MMFKMPFFVIKQYGSTVFRDVSCAAKKAAFKNHPRNIFCNENQ